MGGGKRWQTHDGGLCNGGVGGGGGGKGEGGEGGGRGVEGFFF